MKFYKRDPDAAIAGMADLTLQERGAYNSILDLLYSRDGALPNNDDMLRRMLSCHGNEWRKVKAALVAKGKIWVEGGYLKAKRVDSVLKEAENFSETQRKRAEKRWETEKKIKGNAEKPKQNHHIENARSGLPLTPTPTPTIPISKDIGRPAVARFTPENERAELYRYGKEILGRSSGGVITNLLILYDEKQNGPKAVRKALNKIRDAADQRDPVGWLNAFMWKSKDGWGKELCLGPLDSNL